MSIFTRKGDSGMTSLAGGTRVDKDDVRVEAYGTLDELNSFVGLLKSRTDEGMLENVQRKLFCIGGYLASEDAASSGITAEDIALLEHTIETLEQELEPLRHFILPGGTQAASLCHVCRTVCRRAERRMITLRKASETQMDDLAFQFINRLSDFFFVLARKLNKDAGIEDVLL